MKGRDGFMARADWVARRSLTQLAPLARLLWLRRIHMHAFAHLVDPLDDDLLAGREPVVHEGLAGLGGAQTFSLRTLAIWSAPTTYTKGPRARAARRLPARWWRRARPEPRSEC